MATKEEYECCIKDLTNQCNEAEQKLELVEVKLEQLESLIIERDLKVAQLTKEMGTAMSRYAALRKLFKLTTSAYQQICGNQPYQKTFDEIEDLDYVHAMQKNKN